MAKKTLGCEWLNYGLYITPNAIFHCCSGNQNKNKSKTAEEWSAPIAVDNPNQYEYDKNFFETIIASKQEIINNINAGISCECTGCTYLYEGNWEEASIKILSMAPDWSCNANCYYCMQYDHAFKPTYDVNLFINGLINSGILNKDGLSALFWTGGEFTIAKYFKDAFEVLDKHTLSSTFISSGILYSDVVTQRLNTLRHSSIVISIDSGNKETYQKIKRVNQFDKVLSTIKQYSQNVKNQSRVAIKYIILPENCSKQEIDSFFQMLIDNDLTKCSIVLDVNFFEEDLNNDILSAVYYFSMRLLQLQGRYPYVGYGTFRMFPWLERLVNYNNSEFIRRSFETLPFSLSNYYIVRKSIDIIIPLIFKTNGKNDAFGKISIIINIMKKMKKLLNKTK